MWAVVAQQLPLHPAAARPATGGLEEKETFVSFLHGKSAGWLVDLFTSVPAILLVQRWGSLSWLGGQDRALKVAASPVLCSALPQPRNSPGIVATPATVSVMLLPSGDGAGVGLVLMIRVYHQHWESLTLFYNASMTVWAYCRSCEAEDWCCGPFIKQVNGSLFSKGSRSKQMQQKHQHPPLEKILCWGEESLSPWGSALEKVHHCPVSRCEFKFIFKEYLNTFFFMHFYVLYTQGAGVKIHCRVGIEAFIFPQTSGINRVHRMHTFSKIWSERRWVWNHMFYCDFWEEKNFLPSLSKCLRALCICTAFLA